MASSLAASGLLFPRIRTASSRPPRLATQSRVRLLPAATSAARAHLRFVAHRTASAPSGISNDTTGLDDGVAEDGDDIDEPELPWWAPSIEELIEFDKTDFSPRAIEERFVRESKEAAATVKGAAAGLLLRPLRDLFDDVRKFKSVFDIEEFHIGLPLSALMACVAAYHVWKAAPSACIDFVLHYGFYRLCVMAAGIRRRGFATDMIIRLKLFIAFAMVIKDLNKGLFFLGYVRFALFAIYLFSVGFEVRGLKKYGRYILPCIFDPTPQGEPGWLDTLSEVKFVIDDDD